MEEDEDSILERLFFKKFGRALPEKEKENDVDNIKFVIDLTDDTNEMEVAAPVVVVKTEPIETPEIVANNVNVANVNNVYDVYNKSGVRVSRRLELIELAKARKAITEFGKNLRKNVVIPEKEAPLAAGTENVIADNDTDMAEANSVTTVNPEPVTTVKTVEQVIAEIDAVIAANHDD
jgi:hypothetical protein